MAKSHILDELEKKFVALPEDGKGQERRNSISVMSSRKFKELKVLDNKLAQNISILLGGTLKQMDHQAIKISILKCDHSVLTQNVMEQLIQYWPGLEQLNELKGHKSSYDEMIEAEKFVLDLSDIDRLVPRLKAMLFRLRYKELEQDTKPYMLSIQAAIGELKTSKKFSKILELILLLGNYINCGSRNEGAFGYNLSFLPNLKSTKDIQNKSTLLHFLVETIEKDYHELLSFGDELSHLDEANKVSTADIRATLEEIGGQLDFLKDELKMRSNTQNPDDKFLEVIGTFYDEVRQEFEVMQEMLRSLQELHQDLGDYFSFSPKNYSLQSLFADITEFKNSFMEAYKEIKKERELEEKKTKLRIAREKAESEKKLKRNSLNKKSETLDECLLDVLENTGAYSKLRRKRSLHPPDHQRPQSRGRSRSRGE